MMSDVETGIDQADAVLGSLGLDPVINAAGAPSRLGGSVLEPEVRAAMDAAAQRFIPLAEMQAVASGVIAEVTGAEAGCIASGAAACLLIAAAACMTKDDPAAIDRLPDTAGLPNEIVVHRAHRNPFDHALRASGARLVEFGYLGAASGVGAFRWQLDAAITDRTAAVFYLAWPTPGVLPLSVTAEIAHAHGIPVIVDGAPAIPPATNFRRLFEEGADLVAFSGGKLIRGPSASGFLAGRRDLVRAATLHQQDMHVHPDLWAPPEAHADAPGSLPEPPHQGIGRALKVGKEEIAGLIVALRSYVARDHAADDRRWASMARVISDGVEGVPGVAVRVVQPPEVMVPQVVLKVPDGATAARAVALLQTGRPRVFVAPMRIRSGEIVIDTGNILDAQVQPLIDRLTEVLRGEIR